jgi:hypothetical protein
MVMGVITFLKLILDTSELMIFQFNLNNFRVTYLNIPIDMNFVMFKKFN